MDFTKIVAGTLFVLALTACDSSTSPAPTPAPTAKAVAAIAMVASDYSSSSIAIVSDKGEERSIVEGYLPETQSDYGVDVRGEDIYRFGRYDIDNITRVSVSNPNMAISQISSKDKSSDPTTNPLDFAYVSDEKAYLLRRATSKLWVVNPKATTLSTFKLGEIDLSAYDTAGVPEMSHAIVIDKRLYVVMQRLNGFSPDKVGYVAVIDTDTDTEIDTTPADSANLNGIALNVQNPYALSVNGTKIYIGAIGQFGGVGAGQSGGVDVIDISASTLSAENLWLDADAAREEGGVYDLVVMSPTEGFVLFDEKGFAATERSLYSFNPTTKAISPSAVSGFKSIDIRDVALSPTGEVWVTLGDVKKPEIAYLNAEGKEGRARTSSKLVPEQVKFF